ncbi:AMP-binding protein [Breznakibacter xylanolyticus]|nr:AMP-binding protein [Breznakibacter xylanolyticus]
MQMIINHQVFDGANLRALIDEKMRGGEDWERAIFGFMHDWFSPSADVLMHTSGSTGVPKAMTFPKTALVASARATIKFFGLLPGDKVLLCLPGQYVAARLMVVRAIVGGLDLVMVPPGGNPLAQLTCAIDFAAMVPLQVERAMNETPEKFSLLRRLIIGGAAVSLSLGRKLAHLDTHVWETYGMTETLTHVAVRCLTGKDASDHFEALPGVHFTLTDADCLVVHVPHVTPQPVVTNDMVALSDGRYFRLLGRADDVINSGGIKIHPVKIEFLLAPLIKTPFAITSEPHELLGEQVVLVVESGVQFPCPQTLFADIDKHQRPRKIYMVDALPQTESGKIRRAFLKACLKQARLLWERNA